ncbi:MAG TPA: FAD-binding oxidoreductase [Verrucomicrobiae bacterium]|jgi:FAD/FMN-containing dehydrogenase
MRVDEFQSWGRVQAVRSPCADWSWLDQAAPLPAQDKRLAYGLGRSYGDSCLLSGGVMIRTRGLNKLIQFDRETGVLRAEAGVSLSEILEVAVPAGWFLPTSPGTRFITLAGAIANDIHGKNHHAAGAIGCHVRRFCVLRSDGTRWECGPAQNERLFAATIGGLGLTGVILWAEIQLARVPSAWLNVELIPFTGVNEFMALSADSSQKWEHTVAWFDAAAQGKNFARGIYIRGNFTAGSPAGQNPRKVHAPPRLGVPITMPNCTLNMWSVRAFNALYFHRVPRSGRKLIQHYEPFFYPLDALNGWSRIYGRRGFFQYQSVTPESAGAQPLVEMAREISASGEASFLAVLKTFGPRVSPGMLSFPKPGITLALDFPNRGRSTLALFNRLDAIVRAAGGRLYPAKDSRMSGEDFRRGYPGLNDFLPQVDRAFCSDFWKRVAPEF